MTFRLPSLSVTTLICNDLSSMILTVPMSPMGTGPSKSEGSLDVDTSAAALRRLLFPSIQ